MSLTNAQVRDLNEILKPRLLRALMQLQQGREVAMLLATWDEPGAPTVSVVYDDEAQGLRIATSVDNVPVPGYYDGGGHFVGGSWLGMYDHDYQPENIAGDIVEIFHNRQLAPKVMWYRGENYSAFVGRLAAGRPRPGRVVFDPANPGAVNNRNAPQNRASDPLGIAGVVANNTSFINSNWSEVNRPSNNTLARYRYLEGEVRRNGTVPRVYHENAIQNVRNGCTGRRHPFTRQPWTANMNASVRRLR
jgi:hypothetical protein